LRRESKLVVSEQLSFISDYDFMDQLVFVTLLYACTNPTLQIAGALQQLNRHSSRTPLIGADAKFDQITRL